MDSHSQAREHMFDLLTRDLYGPYNGPDEILDLNFDETPLSRYITGVLYPQV